MAAAKEPPSLATESPAKEPPPAKTVEDKVEKRIDAPLASIIGEDQFDVHADAKDIGQDLSTLGRIDRLLSRGQGQKKTQWRFGLPIFYPQNRFKAAWDLVMMFLLLYNVSVVPFRIAFDVPAEDFWAGFELFVDAMFAADVLTQFRTAFYNEVGTAVDDGRLIAVRYLRTWFLLDFLSALPVDTILRSIVDNNPAFRLPRLLRLVRLFRMFSFLRRIADNSVLRKLDERLQVNPSVVRLCKFVFWLALIAHWFSCIQFFVARMEEFPETSWVVHLALDDAPTSTQYIATIYWVTTTLTTVGYGDIVPGTDAERLVTLFMQLAGATVFAWIAANMTQLISSLDVGAARKQKKMEQVKHFMRNRRLPGDMQKRVEKYFQFVLSSQNLQEETEIMDELTPALRTEIKMYLHKDIIEKVPFFHKRDPRFIGRIVALLKPTVAAPNDLICEYGEQGREMFLLSRGIVQVYNSDRSVLITTLKDGSFFGEISALFGERRIANCVAHSYCELFSLAKADLEGVLADFPEIAHDLQSVALQRKKRMERTLKRVQAAGRFILAARQLGKIRNSLRARAARREAAKAGGEAPEKEAGRGPAVAPEAPHASPATARNGPATGRAGALHAARSRPSSSKSRAGGGGHVSFRSKNGNRVLRFGAEGEEEAAAPPPASARTGRSAAKTARSASTARTHFDAVAADDATSGSEGAGVGPPPPPPKKAGLGTRLAKSFKMLFTKSSKKLREENYSMDSLADRLEQAVRPPRPPPTAGPGGRGAGDDGGEREDARAEGPLGERAGADAARARLPRQRERHRRLLRPRPRRAHLRGRRVGCGRPRPPPPPRAGRRAHDRGGVGGRRRRAAAAAAGDRPAVAGARLGAHLLRAAGGRRRRRAGRRAAGPDRAGPPPLRRRGRGGGAEAADRRAGPRLGAGPGVRRPAARDRRPSARRPHRAARRAGAAVGADRGDGGGGGGGAGDGLPAVAGPGAVVVGELGGRRPLAQRARPVGRLDGEPHHPPPRRPAPLPLRRRRVRMTRPPPAPSLESPR